MDDSGSGLSLVGGRLPGLGSPGPADPVQVAIDGVFVCGGDGLAGGCEGVGGEEVVWSSYALAGREQGLFRV